MGNIHTVGPNEALVVSGGCCGSQKKIIVGGWSWVWWFVSDIQRLSLEVMTLNPRSENVETIQGVQITVTGVAQCKVMKAEEILYTACEQFLGKKQNDIRLTILQTLEGHLRSIIGTLTVEEVYKDREQFAALVREVAATDVGRMGIEILSFTIKDVFDHVHYLESLGKSQIASVKAEAEIGVAEANSIAGINEANYEKSALDIKYESDTVVEGSTRHFLLEKSKYDQEVNKFKAKAELAYNLEAAKIQQTVRFEEMQVQIVERHKQIEIESIEVDRKEKELQATTRLPAAAESYQIEALASARKAQAITIAEAEAERIRKLGSAEATVIAQRGEAEASAMQAKAQAYKMYGNAALVAIVLDALPKLAAEIAAPLTKTNEIVMLGGTDPLTNELGRVATQLPVALNAMTGLSLAQSMTRMTSSATCVTGLPSSSH